MFSVGQEVVFAEGRGRDSYTPSTGYGYYQIKPGAIGIVKRVYTNSMMVRFPAEFIGRTIYTDGLTFTLPIEDFVPADPNMPRPRRLGQKPDGDEYLDPNDPRLLWFWDDVAKYADRSNWCSTFDSLAAELNVPGRKRDISLTIIVGNGIEAKTTVKARSHKEARDLLTAEGIQVKN